MGDEFLDSVSKMQIQLHDMLRETKKILDVADIQFFLGYGTALGAVRGGDYIPWDTDSDLLVFWEDYPRMLAALANLPSPYVLVYEGSDYQFEFARVARIDIPNEYLHIDLFPMVKGCRSRWMTEKRLYLARRIAFATWLREQAKRQVRHPEVRKRVKAALALFVLGWMPRQLFRAAFNAIANLKGNGGFVFNVAGSYGPRELIPQQWLQLPESATLRGDVFLVPGCVDEYLTHLYGDYMTPPGASVLEAEAEYFGKWYLPVLASKRIVRATPLE